MSKERNTRVELVSETTTTIIDPDTDKMDIRLVRVGLEHETSQEAYHPAIFFEGKTRLTKMNKVQSSMTAMIGSQSAS